MRGYRYRSPVPVGHPALVLLLGALLLTTAASAGSATAVAAEKEEDERFVTSVDDELFDLQWYLRRINAPAAWDSTRGASEVTVAVVDTGVDPAHRDLDGAFALDPLTGSYGLDLFRFARMPYYTAAEDWHGTAIAGIVAARAGDGYGIAGVAPEVSVRVYKIYGSPDDQTAPVLSGGYDPAVTAIREATADGADVILLTWGGQDLSLALRNAITASGVPVVAAAGNDGVDLSDPDQPLRRYPAMLRLSNLVTVTASDRNDRAWTDAEGLGANVGIRHVDIAAPGDRIVAPWAGQAHRFHAGTSFAAPQVAGALALAVSVAPRADASRLVAELSRTARPVPAFADQVTSGGVLDVDAFLRAVQRPICVDDLPAAGYLDVDPNSTHARSIDCVTTYEVTRGVGGSRFDPAGTVTRGQMASFLARTLARAGALEDPDTLSVPGPDHATFSDTADSVHVAAIEAIAELDIARGFSDGTFRPGAPVDRGQMAAFLVRAIQHVTGDTYSSEREWFDDTVGTTHEEAITAARELGITFGTQEPRRYEPAQTLSRAQMAAFLARSLDALAREGAAITRP